MVEFCATDVGKLSQAELFKRGWGGDTSNFVVSAARTGSKTGYMCRLGDDEFGRSFKELWGAEGVDYSRVIVDPGGWTAIYIISLMEGGGHDFTYYRSGSAASRYCVEDLDQDYVASAKVFHASGITLAVSESLREAALQAMDICKEAGGMVTLDINMRTKLWPIKTARTVLEQAFRRANTVFASAEDLNTLYGANDPSIIAKYIRGLGPENVVIKLGSRGCQVESDDEAFRCPGFKVETVDTTGAGDAFDGAWVTAIIDGWTLKEAARFANAAGAITATGLGAVAPIPFRSQVLNMMEASWHG